MLSPADQAIVDREAKLPALQWLLDPMALGDWGVGVFATLEVRSLEVRYLRYKPGTSCLAQLSMQTSTGEQSAYVIAYPDSDSARRAAKRTNAAVVNETLIVAFPHDRRLPGLSTLADPVAVMKLLRRLHVVKGDCEPTVTCSVNALRHKPERRLVARVERAGRPLATVRLYSRPSFGPAKQAFRALRWVAPELEYLGSSDRAAAIAARWIEGKPLNPQVSPSAFGAAGDRLARLHTGGLTKLRKASSDYWSRRVLRANAAIQAIAPGLSARLEGIAVFDNDAFSGPCATTATLHGDAHLEQFLVNDAHSSASLIDFDHALLGPPEWDLANLAADLKRSGQVEAFESVVEGYDRPIDRRLLDRLTAVRLLELVVEPFRRREREWFAESERLFDLSKELLLSDRARPLSYTSKGAVGDDKLPTLQHALSRTAAERELRNFEPTDDRGPVSHVDSIEVLRHKPGRRCLIGYQVRLGSGQNSTTLLGKVEAKSRCSLRLRDQCNLWRSGFDHEASDGIVVARPWGEVTPWRMWVQEWVPGETLTQRLQCGDDAAVGRVAKAIAKLHSVNLPLDRQHSAVDEANLLAARLSQAAAVTPRLARRLNALVTIVGDLLHDIADAPSTSVHRDFYSDQALLCGDRVALLDFDLLCRGDPAIDIGNFIGCLFDYSLRMDWRQSRAERVADFFFDAYPWGGDSSFRRRVDIYALATVSRHIELAQRLPKRQWIVVRLIELAENLASQANCS